MDLEAELAKGKVELAHQHWEAENWSSAIRELGEALGLLIKVLENRGALD
jgi:hypothetical protein